MPSTSKNSLVDELILQDKQRFKHIYALIKRGVKIMDPFTTHIGENVTIGRNTVIYPMTMIESGVVVGRDCRIGPFARLRHGVKIKDKATIGNFVEVVRSTIDTGVRIKHLTYVGDTHVEKNANIGAGTIIANYDGKEKHKTIIKQGAFIGSGSILVAPVSVGREAVTGAGAVVTKNTTIPDKTIVIGVPARILKKRD